jgi:hypothetical protein
MDHEVNSVSNSSTYKTTSDDLAMTKKKLKVLK